MSFAERVVDQALRHLGAPYIWGGHGVMTWQPLRPKATQLVAGCPEGYDCAGLVTACVLDAHGPDLRWTWNAQTMCDKLPILAAGDVPEWALLLYGKDEAHVSHVALQCGPLVLEAAGGDATTRTYADAVQRGACVRIGRPRRQDLLARRSLAALETAAP